MLPNLTPVTMYCVHIANVRLNVTDMGKSPKFDYKIHNSYMDSYIWIMFHQPSRAAHNSGLGVLCDLAMIYNEAFLYKKCTFIAKEKPTYKLMFCIRK